MLSRLIPKPSSLRILTLISSKSPVIPHARQPPIFISHLRTLCTNRNNGGNDGKDDTWKFSEDIETKLDPFFAETSGSLSGGSPAAENDSWLESNEDEDSNVFEAIEKEENAVPPRRDSGGGGDDWLTAEENSTWNLADEGKDYEFDVGVQAPREDDEIESRARSEIEEALKNEQLEREKKELTAILQGPDRAFGDLISASGITDEMLDSLIALKDFQGVDGLPPLTQLEDERYEKNTKKSSRAEIERQKQEEVAKSRVRKVDEKGKAYGTGRRKCSIARVWIQPGDGNFVINDKEFDVYFPMLDHRAALLRPFSETKSLGLWDVKCTVKGGGTTGQVGAIQLGISRALQNWEPDLRPPLRAAGFLTRDPRVVERKKPGKAKARKSFQWVKR